MAQNRSANQHSKEEEENLPGTFSGSLIVGTIILLIWISAFAIFISRL